MHPDAELHLFYGWDGYDIVPDPTGRRAHWKRQMLELLRQPGIFEHGLCTIPPVHSIGFDLRHPAGSRAHAAAARAAGGASRA